MQKKGSVLKSGFRWIVLVAACGLMVHCGGEDSSAGDEMATTEDALDSGCLDAAVNCAEESELCGCRENTPFTNTWTDRARLWS